MKITEIRAKNYKGIEEIEVSLQSMTMFKGVNRAGKSTMADIISDILTGKLMDGSMPDHIRPMDEHVNDKNNDPIIRGIRIEIDGAVYDITKTTSKKFAKNRQTGELVFKGNEDSYEIDGFPMKKSEYQKWLAERGITEESLFCIVSKTFIAQMAKNTVTARKTLMRLSGYDPSDFAKKHPEYADVVTMLKGHAPDELKKKLNGDLKRAKATIDLCQSSIGMLKELSADREIAESPEKAELEAEMARFQKCLDDKKQKLADLLADGSPDIQSLVDKQNEIVRKANESLMAQKAEEQNIIMNLQKFANEGELKLNGFKSEFAECKKQYEANCTAITDWQKKLAEIQNASYDVQTKCPTCGQFLPAEEVAKTTQKLKAENRKAEDEAEKQIAMLEKQIKYLASKMRQLQTEYKAQKGEVDAAYGQIEEHKALVFPNMKLIDDIPEAKALDDEIAKLKARQQNIDVLNKDIRSLEDSIFKFERRIKEIDFGAELKAREAEADKKRMEDQKAELAKAQAEYGAIMGTLDKLKDFSMMSNRYLEDHINSFFTHFQFALFGETQSGEAFETCQMLVDGIPYGNGLNHGDMILCEIDLAKGFQKMLGKDFPIIVDDSESLDEDRIPKLDNQLIVLRRTDDKELTVAYGKG